MTDDNALRQPFRVENVALDTSSAHICLVSSYSNAIEDSFTNLKKYNGIKCICLKEKENMKKILSMLVISLLLLSTVSFARLTHATGATIWTDKGDYGTHDTVTIFGSGFEDLATVTITVDKPDGSSDNVYAVTDNAGSFTCTYQLNGIEGTYTLTATDGTNTATTTFTEAKCTFTITIDTVNGYSPPFPTLTNPIHLAGSASAGPNFPGQLSAYQVQVDWGDGTVDPDSTVNFVQSGTSFSGTWSSSPDHNYAAGSYTIAVKLYHQRPPGAESGDSSANVTIQVVPPTVQYYLTVADDIGGLSGVSAQSGWFDGCTMVSLTAPDPVPFSLGVQYRFDHWDVDTVGVPGNPIDVHMDAPHTATAHYVKQYYLDVISPYDTPSGAGWFDENSTAFATLATGVVDIVPGWVRAVFAGWSGDASGTGLTSDPIYMDGPKTAVADWMIQYYLDVITDPSTLPPIPGADWYDNCTWVSLTAFQYVPVSLGVRYNFSYWDVDTVSQGMGVNPIDIHMNAPHIATAHYVLQYLVTFNQTGVDSDFTGTVVVIDSANYGVSALPVSFWYDSGSHYSFAFQSPLVVPPGAKQYVWSSTSGLSTLQSDTITVTSSGSVTGNYMTQVHDVAVTNVFANRTWVYQGKSCGFGVNVTVLNKGDFPENVAVTLYYNITANEIIGTQNINLLPSQSKTLVFTWDTTNVEYCHNYTITAVATIMPADYTPADNTLDNVYVKVRIMGDLNGDGYVGIDDIFEAGQSFGAEPGHPRWNVDADMNQDEYIGIDDIFIIASHFGQCL